MRLLLSAAMAVAIVSSAPARAAELDDKSLAPAWVPNFCHVVRDYQEVFAIIAGFAHDPVAYWQKAGIPEQDLFQAWDNAIRSKVIIPPYLQQAILTVRGRREQSPLLPAEPT